MQRRTMIPLRLLSIIALGQALAEAKTTRDQFLVNGLGDLEPAYASFEGDIYAGPVPIKQKGGEDGELFFMMFDPSAPTMNDTLVIWLNGGPGCSSFAGGLFFENGPVTVPLHPAGFMGSVASPKLSPNEYAWSKATAIMYLEQPAGVGFTRGRSPDNEAELSADFYNFMQEFYRTFGEMRSKRLFIIGESYAGMYVPSMAYKVYQENKKLEPSDPKKINLAGIGIGNGWIDARVQGAAVIDYAWWHGMIDAPTKDVLHEQFQHCLERDGPPPPPPFHPFTTPDECGTMGVVLSAAGTGAMMEGDYTGGPNTYDVSTWDTYPVLFSHNGTIASFFNDPAIREAIHAPLHAKEWAQCIPGAGRRRLMLLNDDTPISVVPYIAELLDEGGVQVLVYNGDRDMSCCVQGSENLLNEMEWSGAPSWSDPEVTRRGLWMVDGKVAGYAKGHKGLKFVVVYNSGHLVPYNQPENALDLVTRFLGGKSFSDVYLPAFSAPTQTINGHDYEPRRYESTFVFIASCCSFVAGIGCALAFSAFKRKSKALSYEAIPPSPGFSMHTGANYM